MACHYCKKDVAPSAKFCPLCTEHVKLIIANYFGNVHSSKLTEDTNFIDDLGTDSLDTMNLVTAFEENFGVEISDREAEKILTIGDAIKFLKKSATW
jgi:acyl carrier protein